MESNDKIKIILEDNDIIQFKLDNKIEKVTPPLENLEVNPSKEEQIHKSKDYYGYDEVKVNKVTNSIDENIKPENIKKDINILGVTGNLEEINTTEISVNPTSEEQVITPEEPYNGFSKVIIGAQSGVNIEEYFETTITNANRAYFGRDRLIKKTPEIKVDYTGNDYSYMFQDSKYLKELNIIIPDNKTINSYMMFSGCENLTKITGLDNTIFFNSQSMFSNCKKLVKSPRINISEGSSCSQMFNYCYKLTDISELNTYGATNMYNMFGSCNSLESIGTLDTSKATEMGNMFSSCSKLKDVSNLDTSSATNIANIFSYCGSLETVPLLDASNVKAVNGAFNSCPKLVNFDGLKDLGKSYPNNASTNTYSLKLDLGSCINLQYNCLINILNNLYDIASLGIKPQQIYLSTTNMNKLKATEEGLKAIENAQNKGWSIS